MLKDDSDSKGQHNRYIDATLLKVCFILAMLCYAMYIYVISRYVIHTVCYFFGMVYTGHILRLIVFTANAFDITWSETLVECLNLLPNKFGSF